jgi:ABC-type multidrug transport system fused ATPase/permease subunit
MKKLTDFLKMAWAVSPDYIILLMVQSITSAAKLWLNVILPKVLIDELLDTKNISDILCFAGLIILNNVGMAWLEKLYNRQIEVKKEYMRRTMTERMAEKIMNLEYSYLEDPYYLDLKERAVFAIGNQNAIAQIVTVVSQVFSGAVTLIGLFSIIATLGPVMIVVLILGIAAVLLIYKNMSETLVSVMDSIIPINRKFGYYLSLENEKQYQKDIRLYHMQEMITKQLSKFTEETCDRFDKMYKKQGQAFGGINVVNDAIAAFCYIYVGLRTLSDRFGSRISIGSLTMYVSAAVNFSASVVTFGTAVVEMFQVLSFLDPYLEFMSLKEEMVEEGKEKLNAPIETVEFSHVTFTYPKAEKPVLKNVTFSIHKGEKISIVGLNGAGKSTLVKLICRMYRADSGEIKINGKNIYEYDYQSYMNAISAVFQDYRLFNFTIAENISCSEQNVNQEKIDRLIEEVGLREKIDSLKDGVYSRFGKEYEENGIEMSGGEGQKVAIARALYKDASMVILDEPASALDPIAEAEIYEKFNCLVDDKTAIYISHRMSSSVFCDKILIIDGGTVADFDTHENLMKKTDSLYYKLFHSQAENYKLNIA